jgi:precorrin-4/cobalt-precorrin-4 C11-methyltransferase
LPQQSPIVPQVYIIGVGPGDPDLLTVKAQRIIAAADVILYADSLIPDRILQATRSTVEIIKTSDRTLEEIIAITLDRVRAGLTIARLHSGDLTLYSAITEQIRALREAKIAIELVPGIGAYQAAAAKLQVELTVPELVQTIILTRPSGRASAVPAAEDLASLAAHRSSLCLYLAARHVETAQAKLLQHYSPDTPVAICVRMGGRANLGSPAAGDGYSYGAGKSSADDDVSHQSGFGRDRSSESIATISSRLRSVISIARSIVTVAEW